MSNTPGKGIQFKLGNAADSLTAIGSVLSVKPGKVEAQIQDVTPVDATADEFAGGIPDNGEVTLRLVLQFDSHITTLRSAVGLSKFGAIVYPTTPAKTDAFACVVKSFEEDEITAKIGAITATAVVKISGPVTRTTAGS